MSRKEKKKEKKIGKLEVRERKEGQKYEQSLEIGVFTGALLCRDSMSQHKAASIPASQL